nr:AfsR/SARP family transcriptional regulator [Kitasatospora viridis]
MELPSGCRAWSSRTWCRGVWVRFSVLGPIDVRGAGGGVVAVRGLRRRTLLAVLLAHANSVVSTDQLAGYLWDGKQPASVVSSLYNQVTRLRQSLGDGGPLLEAVAPGYRLRVDAGTLDLHLFEGHSADARRAAAREDWTDAREQYHAALDLWRGRPFDDVPALADHPRVHQLNEARFQALQGRVEADLSLGHHRDVLGELRALVAEQPLREPFQAQLMLALYRDGRQADALDAYRALRRTLADELAVEPSAASQALHARILRADPALLLSGPAARPARAAVTASPATVADPVPRQLPFDTRVFTGRSRELEELLALSASASAGSDAGMVVISAIDGMAGVGKSALAVRAAHRVSERFPDGQLFVDLRGGTTGLEPVTADAALAFLLRSLGVAPESIPEDTAERAALYRSRLAGTRTLIVLDNAAGTAQVRPLLPGTPGCLVLITSRTVLAGLDDAHLLSLDVLPGDEALALLHRVAGPDRTPAGHPAASQLVALCGGLPLAVRIVGARLRHHRALRIEDLLAQIHDSADRLSQLQDGERNLRSLFDASYAVLYGDERRMFELVGLAPGPDLDAHAAADMFGTSMRHAERLLESLLDRSLLLQSVPGRYRMHDLLRAYARGLAQAAPVAEAGGAVAGAMQRLLDCYLHTAHGANQRVDQRADQADAHSAALARP